MNSFMIDEKYDKILKIKSAIKFSFVEGFNKKTYEIEPDNLKDLCQIDPAKDSVDCLKTLIIGDAFTVTCSDELYNSIPEKDKKKEIDKKLTVFPICIYHESIHGFAYFTKEDFENFSAKIVKTSMLEPTTETFYIPRVGDCCKLVRKKIQEEIGEKFKTQIFFPHSLELHQEEEDLVSYYDGKKTVSTCLNVGEWNSSLEFMILKFGNPFKTVNRDLDYVSTAERGGTTIQPVQVAVVGKEAVGWIPLTTSRIRYGIELIKKI